MNRHFIYSAFILIATLLAYTSCKQEKNMYIRSCMTKTDIEGEAFNLVTDDTVRIISKNMQSDINSVPAGTRLIGDFYMPMKYYGNTEEPIEVEFISLYTLPSDTIKITSQPDTLGKNRLAISDVWISGGYYDTPLFINFNYFYKAGISDQFHYLYLAENPENKIDNDGYVQLTLKHDALNDMELYVTSSTYSFKLSEEHKTIKGFKITFTDLNESDKASLGIRTLNSPIIVEL